MVFDQSLFEKVILLALTAIVSGLGVPWVLKCIDQRRTLDLRRAEAALARQTKIIEAQSKLLDDLAQALWQWRYLGKKVVYYADLDNREAYMLAVKEYEAKVWDVLNALRVHTSASRRLVSEDAYDRLVALYRYVVDDVDPAITDLVQTGALRTPESNMLANRFSGEVSDRLDEELDRLAAEVGLKVGRSDAVSRP